MCTSLTLKRIRGFRHKGLEDLYRSGKNRRVGSEIIRKCIWVLQLLDVASGPEEMKVAGLRFHALQGKPPRWSVRVTGNYRITFGWLEEDALEVDLEEYH